MKKRKFLIIISLLILFLSAVTIGSDLIMNLKLKHIQKEIV